MTGRPDNSEEDEGANRPGAQGTAGGDPGEGDGSSSFSVPGWARPGGDAHGRIGWRDWRIVLRRRIAWPVVVILVLIAVWINYPFIPNPWALLFRQPAGEATAVSTPQSWAMYGAGAEGTNYIPGAAAPEGVVTHTIDLDGGVRSAPAVADGTVYVGGQSRIAAYSADTGEMVWEVPVNGPAHGTPAVADGMLYLGMLGKQVLAIDTASGRIVWEYKGDSPFPGSMGVRDGVVYAASRGSDVHALDAESGDLLWRVDTGSPVVSPVAASDGKLFAASTEGVLFIRSSNTGDKRARIRTGGALVAPPVVDGDQVYLLSGGDLLAFDATIRELPGRYPAELIWAQLWIWHFPLPAPSEHAGLHWRVSPGGDAGDFTHPPAVAPEALYLGTDEGFVIGLDRKDGSELLRFPPASELRRVDGNLWWRMSVLSPIAAPILVAGDLLLVAHEDATVRAIDRFSGQEVWAVSLQSPLVAPLSYADGAVYAHTRDGRLVVIR